MLRVSDRVVQSGDVLGGGVFHASNHISVVNEGFAVPVAVGDVGHGAVGCSSLGVDQESAPAFALGGRIPALPEAVAEKTRGNRRDRGGRNQQQRMVCQ